MKIFNANLLGLNVMPQETSCDQAEPIAPTLENEVAAAVVNQLSTGAAVRVRASCAIAVRPTKKARKRSFSLMEESPRTICVVRHKRWHLPAS